MSRCLAAALIVALLGVPATSRAETIRQQNETTFEAGGVRAVRVQNDRGLVRVGVSTDGKLHLTAVKESRHSRRERAERLAAETRVTAEVRDGVLEVRVSYPRQDRHEINLWQILSGNFEYPRLQVRLGLDIPAALAVDLRSTSGDLMTRGLAATQTLASTSGDVSVEDAKGRVQASSTSGDLSATRVAAARLGTVSGDVVVVEALGPLRLRSTSGDLTVSGATDSLDLEAVSGDIDVTAAPRGVSASTTSGEIFVRGAAGEVRLESSSGDIGVRLVDPVRRAEVSTTSGDVTARYLAKAGCTLDLNTASGSIEVSLPVELRSATRRTLRGTVGDGAVPITLTTASGDIAVRGPRN